MGSECCKCHSEKNCQGRNASIISANSTYTCRSRGYNRRLSSDRFRPYNTRNRSSLAIRQLTFEDGGHYAAESEDSYGSSLLASIDVDVRKRKPEVPIFLRRLHDVSAKVGSRARFLVEVESVPPLKITWYHDNQVLRKNDRFNYLEENHHFCLDIGWTMLQDEGHWTCIAENKHGCSVSSSYLTILVPKAYKAPRFVDELKAILAEDGTVSLECKVIGVPTPILHWYKDGKKIKAGDTFALKANSSDLSSLGTYSCVAKNCLGQAFSSSSVHFHTDQQTPTAGDSSFLLGPQPKFVRELRDAETHIEASLKLSCQVVVPPWPKTIDWYNKSGKVIETEKYKMIADGLGMYALEIAKVEMVDDGEWKCVATSFFGIKALTSCYVTVKFPKNYKTPKFLENLRAVMTPEGLVSFECKVIGYPTPQLKWLKDDRELKPGDVYQLTGTNSLGTYCCIAKNSMGEVSSVTMLTLEDIQSQLTEEERLMIFATNKPPYFIKGLSSHDVRINDEFRFQVQVNGKPEPKIFWYRNDELIEKNERISMSAEDHGNFFLNLKNVELKDQAEWKCIAVNDYGQSVTSSYIKLIVPKHYKSPRFLDELKATLTKEGTVNLECKVIGVPQPQLRWYKDGKCLKSGEMHKIISGANGTCCLGMYSCEAINCMGTTISSASLLAYEGEKVDLKKSAINNSLDILSIITEERSSQLNNSDKSTTYEEAMGVSFSFDGKEVSISLYETPDLTEEDALQIVEMYADELTEHVTDQNNVELPLLRFVKETITTGKIFMEATVIDVPLDELCNEELKTDADIENSMMDDSAFVTNNSVNSEEDKNNSDFTYNMLQSSQSLNDHEWPDKIFPENSRRSYDDLAAAGVITKPVKLYSLDSTSSRKPTKCEPLQKYISFDSEDDSLHEFEKQKALQKLCEPTYKHAGNIEFPTIQKINDAFFSAEPELIMNLQTNLPSLKDLSVLESLTLSISTVELDLDKIQNDLICNENLEENDINSALNVLKTLLQPVEDIKNVLETIEGHLGHENDELTTESMIDALSKSVTEFQKSITELKESKPYENELLNHTSQSILNAIMAPLGEINKGLSLMEAEGFKRSTESLKTLDPSKYSAQADSCSTCIGSDSEKMIVILNEYTKELQNLNTLIMQKRNSVQYNENMLNTCEYLNKLVKQMTDTQNWSCNLHESCIQNPQLRHMCDNDLTNFNSSLIQFLDTNINVVKTALQTSVGFNQIDKFYDETLSSRANLENTFKLTSKLPPVTIINYASEALKTCTTIAEHFHKNKCLLQDVLVVNPDCLKSLEDSIEIILNSLDTIEKCSQVEILNQKKRLLSACHRLATPMNHLVQTLHTVEKQILSDANEKNDMTGSQVYVLVNSISEPLQLLKKETSILLDDCQYHPHEIESIRILIQLLAPSLNDFKDSITVFHDLVFNKEPELIDMSYLLSALNNLNPPLGELANSMMEVEEKILQHAPVVSDPKLGVKIVIQSVSALVDSILDLQKDSLKNHSTSLVLSQLSNPLTEVKNSLEEMNGRFHEEDLKQVNITMLKTLSSPFNALQKQLIEASDVLSGDIKNTITDLQRTILTIQDQVSFEYGDEPASIEYNIMTLQTLSQPMNVLQNHCKLIKEEIESKSQSVSNAVKKLLQEQVYIIDDIIFKADRIMADDKWCPPDSYKAIHSISNLMKNYKAFLANLADPHVSQTKFLDQYTAALLQLMHSDIAEIPNNLETEELKQYVMCIINTLEKIKLSKGSAPLADSIDHLTCITSIVSKILQLPLFKLEPESNLQESDNVHCFLAFLQSLNIIRALKENVKNLENTSNTDSVQIPMLLSFLNSSEHLEMKISDLLSIVEECNDLSSEFCLQSINAFNVLNNQLIRLNKCIIDQSMSDDGQKEIPFESSINSFNTLLATIATGDINLLQQIQFTIKEGILNELTRLKNDILFNMSLIQTEDDITFNDSDQFEDIPTASNPDLLKVCLQSAKDEIIKCDKYFEKLNKSQLEEKGKYAENINTGIENIFNILNFIDRNISLEDENMQNLAFIKDSRTNVLHMLQQIHQIKTLSNSPSDEISLDLHNNFKKFKVAFLLEVASQIAAIQESHSSLQEPCIKNAESLNSHENIQDNLDDISSSSTNSIEFVTVQPNQKDPSFSDNASCSIEDTSTSPSSDIFSGEKLLHPNSSPSLYVENLDHKDDSLETDIIMTSNIHAESHQIESSRPSQNDLLKADASEPQLEKNIEIVQEITMPSMKYQEILTLEECESIDLKIEAHLLSTGNATDNAIDSTVGIVEKSSIPEQKEEGPDTCSTSELSDSGPTLPEDHKMLKEEKNVCHMPIEKVEEESEKNKNVTTELLDITQPETIIKRENIPELYETERLQELELPIENESNVHAISLELSSSEGETSLQTPSENWVSEALKIEHQSTNESNLNEDTNTLGVPIHTDIKSYDLEGSMEEKSNLNTIVKCVAELQKEILSLNATRLTNFYTTEKKNISMVEPMQATIDYEKELLDQEESLESDLCKVTKIILDIIPEPEEPLNINVGTIEATQIKIDVDENETGLLNDLVQQAEISQISQRQETSKLPYTPYTMQIVEPAIEHKANLYKQNEKEIVQILEEIKIVDSILEPEPQIMTEIGVNIPSEYVTKLKGILVKPEQQVNTESDIVEQIAKEDNLVKTNVQTGIDSYIKSIPTTVNEHTISENKNLFVESIQSKAGLVEEIADIVTQLDDIHMGMKIENKGIIIELGCAEMDANHEEIQNGICNEFTHVSSLNMSSTLPIARSVCVTPSLEAFDVSKEQGNVPLISNISRDEDILEEYWDAKDCGCVLECSQSHRHHIHKSIHFESVSGQESFETAVDDSEMLNCNEILEWENVSFDFDKNLQTVAPSHEVSPSQEIYLLSKTEMKEKSNIQITNYNVLETTNLITNTSNDAEVFQLIPSALANLEHHYGIENSMEICCKGTIEKMLDTNNTTEGNIDKLQVTEITTPFADMESSVSVNLQIPEALCQTITSSNAISLTDMPYFTEEICEFNTTPLTDVECSVSVNKLETLCQATTSSNAISVINLAGSMEEVTEFREEPIGTYEQHVMENITPLTNMENIVSINLPEEIKNSCVISPTDMVCLTGEVTEFIEETIGIDVQHATENTTPFTEMESPVVVNLPEASCQAAISSSTVLPIDLVGLMEDVTEIREEPIETYKQHVMENITPLTNMENLVSINLPEEIENSCAISQSDMVCPIREVTEFIEETIGIDVQHVTENTTLFTEMESPEVVNLPETSCQATTSSSTVLPIDLVGLMEEVTEFREEPIGADVKHVMENITPLTNMENLVSINLPEEIKNSCAISQSDMVCPIREVTEFIEETIGIDVQHATENTTPFTEMESPEVVNLPEASCQATISSSTVLPIDLVGLMEDVTEFREEPIETYKQHVMENITPLTNMENIVSINLPEEIKDSCVISPTDMVCLTGEVTEFIEEPIGIDVQYATENTTLFTEMESPEVVNLPMESPEVVNLPEASCQATTSSSTVLPIDSVGLMEEVTEFREEPIGADVQHVMENITPLTNMENLVSINLPEEIKNSCAISPTDMVCLTGEVTEFIEETIGIDVQHATENTTPFIEMESPEVVNLPEASCQAAISSSTVLPIDLVGLMEEVTEFREEAMGTYEQHVMENITPLTNMENLVSINLPEEIKNSCVISPTDMVCLTGEVTEFIEEPIGIDVQHATENSTPFTEMESQEVVNLPEATCQATTSSSTVLPIDLVDLTEEVTEFREEPRGIDMQHVIENIIPLNNIESLVSVNPPEASYQAIKSCSAVSSTDMICLTGEVTEFRKEPTEMDVQYTTENTTSFQTSTSSSEELPIDLVGATEEVDVKEEPIGIDMQQVTDIATPINNMEGLIVANLPETSFEAISSSSSTIFPTATKEVIAFEKETIGIDVQHTTEITTPFTDMDCPVDAANLLETSFQAITSNRTLLTDLSYQTEEVPELGKEAIEIDLQQATELTTPITNTESLVTPNSAELLCLAITSTILPTDLAGPPEEVTKLGEEATAIDVQLVTKITTPFTDMESPAVTNVSETLFKTISSDNKILSTEYTDIQHATEVLRAEPQLGITDLELVTDIEGQSIETIPSIWEKSSSSFPDVLAVEIMSENKMEKDVFKDPQKILEIHSATIIQESDINEGNVEPINNPHLRTVISESNESSRNELQQANMDIISTHTPEIGEPDSTEMLHEILNKITDLKKISIDQSIQKITSGVSQEELVQIEHPVEFVLSTNNLINVDTTVKLEPCRLQSTDTKQPEGNVDEAKKLIEQSEDNILALSEKEDNRVIMEGLIEEVLLHGNQSSESGKISTEQILQKHEITNIDRSIFNKTQQIENTSVEILKSDLAVPVTPASEISVTEIETETLTLELRDVTLNTDVQYADHEEEEGCTLETAFEERNVETNFCNSNHIPKNNTIVEVEEPMHLNTDILNNGMEKLTPTTVSETENETIDENIECECDIFLTNEQTNTETVKEELLQVGENVISVEDNDVSCIEQEREKNKVQPGILNTIAPINEANSNENSSKEEALEHLVELPHNKIKNSAEEESIEEPTNKKLLENSSNHETDLNEQTQNQYQMKHDNQPSNDHKQNITKQEKQPIISELEFNFSVAEDFQEKHHPTSLSLLEKQINLSTETISGSFKTLVMGSANSNILDDSFAEAKSITIVNSKKNEQIANVNEEMNVVHDFKREIYKNQEISQVNEHVLDTEDESSTKLKNLYLGSMPYEQVMIKTTENMMLDYNAVNIIVKELILQQDHSNLIEKNKIKQSVEDIQFETVEEEKSLSTLQKENAIVVDNSGSEIEEMLHTVELKETIIEWNTAASNKVIYHANLEKSDSTSNQFECQTVPNIDEAQEIAINIRDNTEKSDIIFTPSEKQVQGDKIQDGSPTGKPDKLMDEQLREALEEKEKANQQLIAQTHENSNQMNTDKGIEGSQPQMPEKMTDKDILVVSDGDTSVIRLATTLPLVEDGKSYTKCNSKDQIESNENSKLTTTIKSEESEQEKLQQRSSAIKESLELQDSQKVRKSKKECEPLKMEQKQTKKDSLARNVEQPTGSELAFSIEQIKKIETITSPVEIVSMQSETLNSMKTVTGLSPTFLEERLADVNRFVGTKIIPIGRQETYVKKNSDITKSKLLDIPATRKPSKFENVRNIKIENFTSETTVHGSSKLISTSNTFLPQTSLIPHSQAMNCKHGFTATSVNEKLDRKIRANKIAHNMNQYFSQNYSYIANKKDNYYSCADDTYNIEKEILKCKYTPDVEFYINQNKIPKHVIPSFNSDNLTRKIRPTAAFSHHLNSADLDLQTYNAQRHLPIYNCHSQISYNSNVSYYTKINRSTQKLSISQDDTYLYVYYNNLKHHTLRRRFPEVQDDIFLHYGRNSPAQYSYDINKCYNTKMSRHIPKPNIPQHGSCLHLHGNDFPHHTFRKQFPLNDIFPNYRRHPPTYDKELNLCGINKSYCTKMKRSIPKVNISQNDSYFQPHHNDFPHHIFKKQCSLKDIFLNYGKNSSAYEDTPIQYHSSNESYYTKMNAPKLHILRDDTYLHLYRNSLPYYVFRNHFPHDDIFLNYGRNSPAYDNVFYTKFFHIPRFHFSRHNIRVHSNLGYHINDLTKSNKIFHSHCPCNYCRTHLFKNYSNYWVNYLGMDENLFNRQRLSRRYTPDFSSCEAQKIIDGHCYGQDTMAHVCSKRAEHSIGIPGPQSVHQSHSKLGKFEISLGIPNCHTTEAENILPKYLQNERFSTFFDFVNSTPIYRPTFFQDIRNTENCLPRKSTNFGLSPTFKNLYADNTVPIGATLALHVEVEGSPRPNIEWIKEEKNLLPAPSRYRHIKDADLHTLIIQNVSYNDAGKYKCRAWNKYGAANASTSINVIMMGSLIGGKPPFFISRPITMMTVNCDSDLSVSFRLSGDPKPKVKWMKGLTDITNTYRSMKETVNDYTRLTLNRAQMSDAGTYFIIAENKYGSDRAFFTLRVTQRTRSLTPVPTYKQECSDIQLYNERRLPRSHLDKVPGAIPNEPSIVEIGKNYLTLSWQKPLNCGGAPVLAYRVEKWLIKEDGGGKWIEAGMTPSTSLDVYNLKSGETYNFKITARNQYGWGEPTVTSTPVAIEDTTEFPEFDVCLPGELKVLADTSVDLECQLKDGKGVHVQWSKDGKQITYGQKYEFHYEDGRCCLKINKLNDETDSGRYVCEASNSNGTICTFVRLMVVHDKKIVDTNSRLNRLRHENDGKVDMAPQFTMRLRNRRIQMCYPIRLTCQVIGYPKPVVSWWMDGKRIVEDHTFAIYDEADEFHSLEITNTKPEHSGTYSVVATTSNGTVSCKCELIVDKGLRTYIGPKFVDKLEKVYTVQEGSQIRLRAVVCAYPAVGVNWQKNGIRLRPNRRIINTISHEGEVELTIAQIKQQDSGIYTCIATNEVGNAETNTRIEVYSKQQSICSGKHTNAEIPADLYSKEPRFLIKPRSFEAAEGDHVIIDCKIIGDPKPEVTWLRDRLKLDYYRDCDEFKVLNEETAPFEYKLEIPRVKFDHTGAYTVVAKNEHDEIKAVVSLQVYSAEPTKSSSETKDNKIKHSEAQKVPEFKRHLTDIKCCDGDAVTFECEVDHEGDSSNIDFHWYKNGKLIPIGNDFQSSEDVSVACLDIKKVYSEDEGQYSCVASNVLGSAETCACLIVNVPEDKENLVHRLLEKPSTLQSRSCTPLANYYDPRVPLDEKENASPRRTNRNHEFKSEVPKFYTTPQSRVVEEGETARFQCTVTGHPSPLATWDKYNVRLIPNSRISIQEKGEARILIISNVSINDEGLYRVVIENEHGHSEASMRLDVINHRRKHLNGYGSYR